MVVQVLPAPHVKFNGMKNEQYNERQVEEILRSLDSIRPASPRPFLFTRIKARMERKEESLSPSRSFFARPAIVLAGLLVVILVNVFILLNQRPATEPSLASQTEQVSSDNDYLMATNTSYDYENLEQ